MSEANPRPPRRRPSRTGRSVPEVEQGRCYVCGAQADTECRHCHRPVCDEHLVPLAERLRPVFGPGACTECAAFGAGDLARDEEQWTRRRANDLIHRTCAECGDEFEQVLPRCSRCGRHLCAEHRVRYRRKFAFGAKGQRNGAWYWDIEVRCQDHRMSPLSARLKGWKTSP